MQNKTYRLKSCILFIAILSSITASGQITYKDLHTIYPLFSNVHTKDINAAVAAINAMMKRSYVLAEHYREGPGPQTAFNDRYVFADNVADEINEEVSISVIGNEYNNWKLSEVRITVFTDNLTKYLAWKKEIEDDKTLVAGQKSLLSEIYNGNFGADIPALKVEVRLPIKSIGNNVTIYERGRYALFYTRLFRN